MNAVRMIAHRALAAIGFLPWLAGTCLYFVSTLCAVVGDKLVPNATLGNCWSYALPRWWRHGGYLLVRDADGQRIMNFFRVPHVIWVKTLPRGGELALEQFVPVKRHTARWFPWQTVYYRGKVREAEIPHNSNWSDL